jgi:Skp family chaperone for outer membrane proteins
MGARKGARRVIQALRQMLYRAAAILCVAAAPVMAQDTGGPIAPGDAPSILDQVQSQMPPRAVTSGIVILNQERLLAQSLYGQRIQRELEAASQALSQENREIESQLTAEELRLTEQRPTMTPAEFRVLAEEFDGRVEAIRSAQEAKNRSLQTQAEAAQARFFELSFPVLLEIVQRRGAAVLMDSRAVLLSAEGVDITDAALAGIDAVVGEGGAAPLVEIGSSSPGNRPPLQRPAD